MMSVTKVSLCIRRYIRKTKKQCMKKEKKRGEKENKTKQDTNDNTIIHSVEKKAHKINKMLHY